MRLKDKVILITGGYTGIGRAIALACLKEGAKIVVNGLRKEMETAMASEVSEEDTAFFTVDITLDNSPELLVDFAASRFGKLDAIVNNAALIASSNIVSTDLGFLRNMLEINTIAPYAVIKAGLPHLAKTKGCVLNIGSINSWSGEPDLLAYSISKGALMTLSRNLGDSLFRDYGVRVNQINPGWVLTENEKLNQKQQGMADDWFTALPDLFAPARRILAPEEIAEGAVYLLSPDCGPVSGQVLELEQYPMIGRNLPKGWPGFIRKEKDI